MAKKQRNVESILSELAEAHLKASQEMSELRESIAELRKGLKESKIKSDQEMHELREGIKESHLKTSEKIDKLVESISNSRREFKSKWGQFMENLVEGDIVSLLRNQGLEIIDSKIKPIPNVVVPRGDGTKKYELDLIIKNGDYAFIVEVKTTLTIADINTFLNKLSMLKDDLPDYQGKTLYACMAYLKMGKDKQEADHTLSCLNKQGIVAIRAPGGPANIATVENAKDFVPKKF